MKPFTKYEGTIVPIMNNNIDTDQLIPKQYLKSVEKTGNITCLGNVLIQSGYSIGIHEPHTNLVGSFLVKNDTHTWENDMYYCDIELTFENVMDKSEFEEKPKLKKSQSKKSKKNKKGEKSKTNEKNKKKVGAK